jgi:cytochrome d ubiquinol oxidase subunit I
MDLPVIEMPIFSRWVWMEEITVSHFIIATLVTAFMVLAPIYEYIGVRKKDLRYDRLAKSLIYFSLILFSPGAALGTGIPIFIIGTYPEFWSRWANLFFWPLIAQFVFFLAEVGFLFFGYYLTWDRMMNRKRLHLFFGVMAAIFGLLVQAVWDGLGSYMLTPGGVALPGVTEPVAWSAQAFFNPSYPFLFFHRFFGNASYAMLLVGGVFALKYASGRRSFCAEVHAGQGPQGEGLFRFCFKFHVLCGVPLLFRHALYRMGVCPDYQTARAGGFSRHHGGARFNRLYR